MKVLVVYDYGGPPLTYFLPALRARADVAVYVPRPDRADPLELAQLRAGAQQVVLDTAQWDRMDEAETERRIVAAVRDWSADAVLCFSELYATQTARAAERAGLRGTSAAGAERARDKLLMREALAESLPTKVRFRPVRSARDITELLAEVGGPVLIKPRRGMSAAGIQRVDRAAEAEAALERARTSMASFEVPGDPEQDFLVEELLVGSADQWYDVPGLSDQVCVEGIVVEGAYLPIAITDVTPKVPPFTQSGHISPTSLDTHGQQRVLSAARRAVSALRLDTCGTHVELKLMPDGECAVIEIAARFAGRTIIPETDYAYGSDLVGHLADALLTGKCEARPLSPGRHGARASATVHCYGSEFLDGSVQAPVAFAGFAPHPADLLDPTVRIAGFAVREHGWLIQDRLHEQPFWLAQVYLQGTSLAEMRQSVSRLRRDLRLARGPE
jgi:biotin carboxylase